MSDATDRVAQAIRDAMAADAGSDPEFPRSPLVEDGIDDVLIDGRFDLRKAARAAIEALRVPTQEMIEASGDDGLWNENDRQMVIHRFSAMIDAALK